MIAFKSTANTRSKIHNKLKSDFNPLWKKMMNSFFFAFFFFFFALLLSKSIDVASKYYIYVYTWKRDSISKYMVFCVLSVFRFFFLLCLQQFACLHNNINPIIHLTSLVYKNRIAFAENAHETVIKKWLLGQ